MFDLIVNWNKDTGFYDDLKINSLDDLTGNTVEWYWFLHEKLEEGLVGLMPEERLVVNWAPGEIVGYQEVGKSYMSIIADEIKSSRKTRLITDDEFFVASKSGLNLEKVKELTDQNQYGLISVAIPKVLIIDKIEARNMLKHHSFQHDDYENPKSESGVLFYPIIDFKVRYSNKLLFIVGD